MKNTDEAPPVAERCKAGSAGGLVEAESDFQSVPTIEYVRALEKRLNIRFPDILTAYYTQCNCSELPQNSFSVLGMDFSVEFIIPLKYGNVCVEKILSFNAGNEYVPKTFIPLAEDIEGEDFYWDASNGKVYYLCMGNVENPIPICDSVETFFRWIRDSVKKN